METKQIVKHNREVLLKWIAIGTTIGIACCLYLAITNNQRSAIWLAVGIGTRLIIAGGFNIQSKSIKRNGN